jgi:hypothetical protein
VEKRDVADSRWSTPKSRLVLAGTVGIDAPGPVASGRLLEEVSGEITILAFRMVHMFHPSEPPARTEEINHFSVKK